MNTLWNNQYHCKPHRMITYFVTIEVQKIIKVLSTCRAGQTSTLLQMFLKFGLSWVSLATLMTGLLLPTVDLSFMPISVPWITELCTTHAAKMFLSHNAAAALLFSLVTRRWDGQQWLCQPFYSKEDLIQFTATIIYQNGIKSKIVNQNLIKSQIHQSNQNQYSGCTNHIKSYIE